MQMHSLDIQNGWIEKVYMDYRRLSIVRSLNPEIFITLICYQKQDYFKTPNPKI